MVHCRERPCGRNRHSVAFPSLHTGIAAGAGSVWSDPGFVPVGHRQHVVAASLLHNPSTATVKKVVRLPLMRRRRAYRSLDVAFLFQI